MHHSQYSPYLSKVEVHEGATGPASSSSTNLPRPPATYTPPTPTTLCDEVFFISPYHSQSKPNILAILKSSDRPSASISSGAAHCALNSNLQYPAINIQFHAPLNLGLHARSERPTSFKLARHRGDGVSAEGVI